MARSASDRRSTQAEGKDSRHSSRARPTNTQADGKREMTEPQAQNLGQSVRTIIELLILAGVIWLASSSNEQGKQLAKMAEQISNLSSGVASVPVLTQRVAEDKVRLDEHERRINEIEQAKRLK